MKIYFDPQPDISAFELATVVSRISRMVAIRYGVEIQKSQWDAMPDGIKRHWSTEPLKD